MSQMLALSKIRPGNNPRRYFDRQKHEELVASFKMRGVLQPPVVRPLADEEDVYQIVAGERRFKAALEAFGEGGEIPVNIREMTDQEALEAAIDENDCREDASETEQADAAVRVLAACGGDRAEAARRLAWSVAKLDRRLALANLSDAVKLALDERRIKVGHAELLAAVPAEKQDKALETILSAGLDVGKTRELLMRVTQSLAGAIFDKTDCTTCPFNSASQRALFETHVDDGHCTNPGCYGLKTEAVEKARLEEQERAAAAKAAEQPAVSENPQSGTCRICGCTDDQACDEPCSWTDDAHTLCDNPDCVAKAAAPVLAQTEAPATTPSASSAAPAPAKAGTASKVTVTAKSLAQRASDLRETMWRTALARALAGDAENATLAILIAGLSGTLSQVKPNTLTARAGLLVDEAFPALDFAGKIEAVFALPKDKALNVLSAIAAAYAKDATTFAHIAALARSFDVDLRATWKVDAAFLGRFNKDEIKFIAQECGLVDHMGAKAFATLLKAKNADLIAGMLNATGFDWSGRLPSAMTLDGNYGPPPTAAKSEAPAAEVTA